MKQSVRGFMSSQAALLVLYRERQQQLPFASIIKNELQNVTMTLAPTYRGIDIVLSIMERILQLTTMSAFLPALSSSKATVLYCFSGFVSAPSVLEGGTKVVEIVFVISDTFLGFSPPYQRFNICSCLFVYERGGFDDEGLDIVGHRLAAQRGVDLVRSQIVADGLLVLLEVAVHFAAAEVQVRVLELLHTFLSGVRQV